MPLFTTETLKWIKPMSNNTTAVHVSFLLHKWWEETKKCYIKTITRIDLCAISLEYGWGMCRTTLFLRKLNGLRYFVTIRLTITAHRVIRFFWTSQSGRSSLNCKSFTDFWLLESFNPGSWTRSRTANWWVQWMERLVCVLVCTLTSISWSMLSPTSLPQTENKP